MTNKERAKESKCTSFQLPSALLDNNIQSHISSCESSTSIGRVSDILSNRTSLNFSNGASLFCITSIVNKQQLMKARERIKKDKEDGSEAVSTLKQSKKLTAGICYKNDVVRLGKSVFEVCKEKIANRNNELRERIQKEERAYVELKSKADKLIASTPKI